MIFSKFKLNTKFTLLLSLVFISGIVVSGVALSEALQNRVEEQITSKALVLMETMNSLRAYTNTRIQNSPILAPILDEQPKFIPETIPTYSVREVFEGVRQNPVYKNFFYKDATLDPTNLRDKADEFETEIVMRFRKEPETKEISGFRNLFGEKVFYIARPFRITEASCLRCHSTPEAAPKNQIDTYGKEHGFGWKLNDIIAAQTIYVPAQHVLDSVRSVFSLTIVIFVVIFALVIILINFLLKRSVIEPIRIMAKLAQKISDDTLSSENAEESQAKNLTKVARRGDELGQLGRVFERMAQEVYAREQRLKQQVQALQIEIDEVIRNRQVAEITEMEYFKRLQEQAEEFKKNSSNESEH